MTREIELTKGKTTLVSDEDYAELSQYKWMASRMRGKYYYAMRSVTIAPKKRKTVLMHRVILNAGSGQCVDHIDGDGLNNTRNNLRLVTNQENVWNQRKRSTNTSGFKGVSWHYPSQKWLAQLCANGKVRHLGLFSTVLDAARAYDTAANKHFGEFARLNFPLEGEVTR